MSVQIIRQSKSATKMATSQQKNLEQVYVKRLQEQEAFMTKDQYVQKHRSLHQVMSNQQAKPLAYYSHINEIRSVKEFLYISDKLKQKNIERKMQERLELKGKLNQIKQIEIVKKLHYYLERKIRLFIKDRQHEENLQLKTFEAFHQFYNADPKIKTFAVEQLREEFIKISAQTDLPKSSSQHIKIHVQSPPKEQKKQYLSIFHDDISVAETQEDGTSKFLTMKAANKLLGLMMIEGSKGKRVPIVWALNKKKELTELLNKPFGGKMNFTMNTFNWLVDNTIEKSKAYTTQQQSENKVQEPQSINQKIEQGLKNITRTLSMRQASANPSKPSKGLKNRSIIQSEYCMSERIKQNVIQQNIRNQKIQEQSKFNKEFFSNDSYVNHYI